MRSVAKRFPDDLQIQTLFAEAMMDSMPWAYWTEEGKPKPLTEEVFATLDYVIERDPDHPGANHFYIHAGRYHDGSTANEHAIRADNGYGTQCRAQGIYLVAYVSHNHHFPWATTTMEGRSADALDATRHTAQHVDRSLMREP